MLPGEDRSALAGDPRFFLRAGPHSLAAVVDAAGAEAPPRRLMLHRIAPLAAATAEDVGFCLNNRKYLPDLEATRAAAVIVHPDMQNDVPDTAVAIDALPIRSSHGRKWRHCSIRCHPSRPESTHPPSSPPPRGSTRLRRSG